MPARITIKQRIPNTITVPVQRQRVPDIPKVTVLRQEVPLHHIIISRPQILAPDIRVIALRIERILIVILRASEGRIAESVVAIGLPQIAVLVRDPCHVSCRIVEVEVALSGEPVFRQPGYAVGVDRIHRAVFVQLHQYLRVLSVDIQDVLDQLIVFIFAGSLDHGDQIRLCPADLLRYREQDAALVLAVMLFGVSRVTVACVVGAFALAVFLVISISVVTGISVSVAIAGVSVVACISFPLSVSAVAYISIVPGITVPISAISGVSIIAIIPGTAVSVSVIPAPGIVLVVPVAVAGIVLPVLVGMEVVVKLEDTVPVSIVCRRH